MVEELHHRVKNILATVQAITSQSLRAAHSVEEGRLAIESRLHALARVHDLLLETNWSKAKLEAILRAGIEPFDTPAAPQIRHAKRGDRYRACCSAPACHGAQRAVHECREIRSALNDRRDGWTSTPTIPGSSHCFVLTWVEKGGPPVQEPTRRSFGSKLIEHAFVAQLQARASLKFDPGGVGLPA